MAKTSKVSSQKRKRGFAAMTPEQRKAIASKGGKAAQAKGTGHRFDHEEAVAAGSKGGKVSQAKGTANRWNSETAKAAVKARKHGPGR